MSFYVIFRPSGYLAISFFFSLNEHMSHESHKSVPSHIVYITWDFIHLMLLFYSVIDCFFIVLFCYFVNFVLFAPIRLFFGSFSLTFSSFSFLFSFRFFVNHFVMRSRRNFCNCFYILIHACFKITQLSVCSVAQTQQSCVCLTDPDKCTCIACSGSSTKISINTIIACACVKMCIDPIDFDC